MSVGPGDPELLTVKALRIMEQSPVLACPRTKNGEMTALNIVRQAMDVSGKEILALDFTMSRDKSVQKAAHERAADKVCHCLEQGKDVSMPNLGDVSIYSTYCYLMELVRKRGFETVMVAGVPSFCAVAARLGISLTEKDRPLHIAPGSSELEEVLHWPGNKILMKSGRQMPEVLRAIDQYADLEKSAMIQNCGMTEEQVYPNLQEKIPEEHTGYFTTVIVKE